MPARLPLAATGAIICGWRLQWKTRSQSAREPWNAATGRRPRDAFGSVLDDGSPEALDGYGQALWFVGEPDAGTEYR